MAKGSNKAAGLSVVKADLPASVFGAKASSPTIHQSVVRQNNNRRAGTKATKARADVRGGGAKPWRQKGTGRARAGSRRSPLWRGGAMIHALDPVDHNSAMPRKMRRVALRGILSERARENAVVVVDKLEIDEPKTRLVEAIVDGLGVSSVTFVDVAPQRNFVLGARNLPEARVLTLSTINPTDLIRSERIVITKDALAQIENILA